MLLSSKKYFKYLSVIAAGGLLLFSLSLGIQLIRTNNPPLLLPQAEEIITLINDIHPELVKQPQKFRNKGSVVNQPPSGTFSKYEKKIDAFIKANALDPRLDYLLKKELKKVDPTYTEKYLRELFNYLEQIEGYFKQISEEKEHSNYVFTKGLIQDYSSRFHQAVESHQKIKEAGKDERFILLLKLNAIFSLLLIALVSLVLLREQENN